MEGGLPAAAPHSAGDGELSLAEQDTGTQDSAGCRALRWAQEWAVGAVGLPVGAGRVLGSACIGVPVVMGSLLRAEW